MVPEPPAGQGPVDPSGAFNPPPPPSGSARPPAGPPPGMPPWPYPPGFFAPPPKPRHGIFRGIVKTLMVLVLLGSLAANFVLLGAMSLSGSSMSGSENTLREGNVAEKIVVLPLHGLVDDEMAGRVNEWLRTVERDDKNVKALVLDVDTPGGTVTASDEIYHRFSEFREKRNIPVAVTMGSMATSGGYYISCAAEQVYAQPTTLTGNIGVLLPLYNFSELASKWGIAETTITAPPNGYKNSGSPLRPMKDTDIKYFQGLIDNAYARFTEVVQSGRKGKLKGAVSELCDGRVFTARDAKSSGLIDDIGYADDAYNWAAKKAGLSKPMIVRYHRRPSLLDAILSKSSTGSPSSTGVNIHIDARSIDEMSTPRAMYLWKGQ